MARVIFHTATTLNGYLADDDDSLSWLFAIPGAAEAENDFGRFLETVGALIMGSTTYEWIVDHEKLGFKMQIFAQVKMTTLTEAERANFYKAINSIPEILECWTVFGEMDAMMKILAPDVTWYQDFIFSVLLKLPGVVDVRSIVTLSAQKSTMTVPLTARQFR